MRVIYWRVTRARRRAPRSARHVVARPADAGAGAIRVAGGSAWGIVLVVSGGVLWANAFAAYLQGLNQVALYRRWEALTSLGAILTSFVVLLMGGRLLALVVANQGWASSTSFATGSWRASWRAAGFVPFAARPGSRGLQRRVAPGLAERAGDLVLARGVVYASGLIYAQVAQAAALSTYLLALRAIQMVSELSQAPFYSKIPLLARLRSEGRFADAARRRPTGDAARHWTYVAGFRRHRRSPEPHCFDAIGSRVEFADRRLWALLGLGFFLERYGAMHIQLYTHDQPHHLARRQRRDRHRVSRDQPGLARPAGRLCLSNRHGGRQSRVLLLVFGLARLSNLSYRIFWVRTKCHAAASRSSSCSMRRWPFSARAPATGGSPAKSLVSLGFSPRPAKAVERTSSGGRR